MPLDVRKAFGLPGSSFFRIVGYAQLLGAQPRFPVRSTAVALPLRCAASLRRVLLSQLNQNSFIGSVRLLTEWLCHADARQVYDLPTSPL